MSSAFTSHDGTRVMAAPDDDIITVFAVCWNEERMLPHFLRHYDFAHRIIVFDNCSTDASADIIRSHPRATLFPYASGEKIRDDIYLDIKNNAWKPYARETDWAIVVDVDEFLFFDSSAGVQQFLRGCRAADVGVPVPAGYQMFSESLPSVPEGDYLWNHVRRGHPSHWYNKMCLFNTRTVSDINYGPGCHQASPVTESRVEHILGLKLLHYKYVHDIDYLVARHEEYGRRLSDINRERGWGFQYTDVSHLHTERDALARQACPVI